MNTLLIIFICITYYITGIGGFVYWWTTEFDLDTRQLLTALGAGFMGPFAWIVGYLIHKQKSSNPTIIIKKQYHE